MNGVRLYWLAVCVGLAGVVALCWSAAQEPSPLKLGLTLTTAGALSAITGGSVAIERTLEAFWTVVDMVAVSGWPVGPQAAKLRDATAAVSKSIGPGITAVEKDLEVFLAKVPNDASRQAKVDEILSVTASIRATLKSVQGETNNGALSRALGSINSDVDAIVAKYPKLTDGKSIDSVVTDAVTAATSLQNLLLTFASNPARRLLSIMAGANLGLAVAFVLHLDVFTAVDAAAPSAQAGGGVSGNLPSIWIAVTGLVMGLGSTPTHELIKALQQRKQESQPT